MKISKMKFVVIIQEILLFATQKRELDSSFFNYIQYINTL